MEDDDILVAVGLRLGTSQCKLHQCTCGNFFNTRGNHDLTCKRSTGRTLRRNYTNDLVYHALLQAGLPSTKEPAGLLRTDGKPPDGSLTYLGKLASGLNGTSQSPIHSLIPI